MKRLKLILINIVVVIFSGCSENTYQVSPMHSYHENMYILNDIGNLKSALKAGCITSAKNSLKNIESRYYALKRIKGKLIIIKTQNDIDELKQLIDKKSRIKNLVCRRFEHSIYRPSQTNLKFYI